MADQLEGDAAQPESLAASSASSNPVRLYIGQLPKVEPFVTAQQLQDAFSKYGRVVANTPGCEIFIAKKPPGFAYIVSC